MSQSVKRLSTLERIEQLPLAQATRARVAYFNRLLASQQNQERRLQPNENRPDLKDLPQNRLARLKSLFKARHKVRLLRRILEHGTMRQKALFFRKAIEELPD